MTPETLEQFKKDIRNSFKTNELNELIDKVKDEIENDFACRGDVVEQTKAVYQYTQLAALLIDQHISVYKLESRGIKLNVLTFKEEGPVLSSSKTESETSFSLSLKSFQFRFDQVKNLNSNSQYAKITASAWLPQASTRIKDIRDILQDRINTRQKSPSGEEEYLNLSKIVSLFTKLAYLSDPKIDNSQTLSFGSLNK